MTRRDFLEKIGWGAILAAVGGLMAAVAQFLEPNLVTPAPGPIEVGRPEDFAIDSITFVEQARAFVGHDELGFYAIAAACTHLGCTAHLADQSKGFVCPCHGSQFSREGTVVSGPATRALVRFFVGHTATGQLFVDRNRVVERNFRLAT